MHLHWHRRDLRAEDNRGLTATSADVGGVLPVFIIDEAVLTHAGPPRVSFLLDALRSLREWYRDNGGDLLVVAGRPATVLPDLAAEYSVQTVTWNQDYSGLARERDDSVADTLAGAGIETKTVHDAVLHPPGTIRTTDGEPYSVFSYYWKKWRDRETAEPIEAPATDALVEPDDPGAIPTLAELGFDEPAAVVADAGTPAARNRIETFCDADIYRYEEMRDYPAEDCTSGLSPHLKFGTIGIRELYDRVLEARDGAPDEAARDSVDEFRSQLAWREFYAQVLYFNPEVVTENYNSFEHRIEWREDPKAFEAWKDGETGYPIVDAGMRQLRAEAGMHNRLRMIVASFLTKDLLLDWRKGYAWFREKLVDHDTANDTGGWQWAASTGTDAQPYFRIFNPMTQGERYDPSAAFIHEYVPELRGVDPERIHSWDELPDEDRAAVAPEYPSPIVDHATRREAALELFEQARGDS